MNSLDSNIVLGLDLRLVAERGHIGVDQGARGGHKEGVISYKTVHDIGGGVQDRVGCEDKPSDFEGGVGHDHVVDSELDDFAACVANSEGI